MGEDYYPLPGSNLNYFTQLGGYRVNVIADQLQSAPKFTRSTEWDWSNRENDRRMDDHYKTPRWYNFHPRRGWRGTIFLDH